AMYCSGYYACVSDISCFLLTFEPIQNSNYTENFGSYTFISRHSPDMKFTAVDKCIEKVSGFKPKDLIGKSAFNFYHTLDVVNVSTAFQNMYNKGQTKTGYYRFIAKTGGYFWLLTEASLITDNHSSQPIEIVCINHVIRHVCFSLTISTGIENKNEVISEEQCQRPVKYAKESTSVSDDIFQLLPELTNTYQCVDNNPVTPVTSSVFRPITPEAAVPEVTVASPQPATATIFAPRTDDMNSGFLVFTNDKATVLTDDDLIDPEQDLTHLAPLAGDSCDIPLDISNLPPLDGLMDDLLKAMGLANCNNALDVASDKNMVLNESEIEANDTFSLDCFTPNDSKLMPYIPPAVVEEEIQFSCDDECGENDTRQEAIDSLNAQNNGVLQKDNSLFNRNTSEECGTSRMNCNEVINDACNTVTEKIESSGDLLSNDPFLSFSNSGVLENFQTQISASKSPNIYIANTGSDVLCSNTSSVWDSPPPSSNNSTLTNDLDICTSLEDELDSHTPQMPLGDDFSLLSDDSMWDSFINSSMNINDLMNSDDFLPTKSNNSDLIGNIVSNGKGPAPTLPLNSNLAMLLQGPSPVVSNASSEKIANLNSKNSNGVIYDVDRGGKLNSVSPMASQNINYANVVFDVGDKKTVTVVQNRGSMKRPYPSTALATNKRINITPSTNSATVNYANSGKRFKVVTTSTPTVTAQKLQPTVSANSVLMNLLVNGEDVNNGYTKCMPTALVPNSRIPASNVSKGAKSVIR
ncbi:hypoxia-inducible factor 1-alpha-like protein, partial [Dinothrombium tinctorium]